MAKLGKKTNLVDAQFLPGNCSLGGRLAVGGDTVGGVTDVWNIG